MSHISEPLKWTNAIFEGYAEGSRGLVLKLIDGTDRIMLYKNWDNSYPTTLLKLKNIPIGSAIKFATWNGYDNFVWFCDVKLV